MTKGRKETFVVTHSHADDPDPRKVEAALEVWRRALADAALAGQPAEERPLARIVVGPKRRGRRKQAGGEGTHE